MPDNNPCCEGSLNGDGEAAPSPGVWVGNRVGVPTKRERGRAAPERSVGLILSRGLLSSFGQY